MPNNFPYQPTKFHVLPGGYAYDQLKIPTAKYVSKSEENK